MITKDSNRMRIRKKRMVNNVLLKMILRILRLPVNKRGVNVSPAPCMMRLMTRFKTRKGVPKKRICK